MGNGVLFYKWILCLVLNSNILNWAVSWIKVLCMVFDVSYNELKHYVSRTQLREKCRKKILMKLTLRVASEKNIIKIHHS